MPVVSSAFSVCSRSFEPEPSPTVILSVFVLTRPVIAFTIAGCVVMPSSGFVARIRFGLISILSVAFISSPPARSIAFFMVLSMFV